MPTLSDVAALARGPARRLMADRYARRAIGALAAPRFERAFAELLDLTRAEFQPACEARPGELCMMVGALGPGGAERQVAITAIGLAQAGHWRPTIATANPTDDPIDGFHRRAVEAAGAVVEHVPHEPARMRSGRLRDALQALARYEPLGVAYAAYHVLRYACYFAERRPMLVQTWMDESNFCAGLGAALAGVPALVVNGRSLAPHSFGIFQPYMRPGYRCLLRERPSLILTNNSEAGAASYARWLGLPPGRIRLLRNGFDFPDAPGLALGAATLRERLGIPATARVLGGLLRFTEEKRPALWAHTALRVVNRDSSAWAVAFGAGPMREALRAMLARASGGERVLLPGLTDDAYTALSAMDVLLLTSRAEGLPNVLVEAQAVGVPVVTTGRGGMRETYLEGETGLTAPLASAGLLARLAGGLLADDARRQAMSRRAMAHAREKFSRGAMLARTTDIFDEAMRA